MFDVPVVAALVGGMVVIGLFLIERWYDRASVCAYEQHDKDIQAIYARHYAEVGKTWRRHGSHDS